MSGADRGVGGYVIWDSSPRAVARVRDAVVGHAATGTLRLVLQQLALHEEGREAGVHEVIDAIVDVGGNLVAYPVREAVRADAAASAALDGALAQLRADIAEELTSAVDSLEVVLDRDGRREVRLLLQVEVSPGELEDDPAPAALHDGDFHIHHHAPALDDLRDRVAEPAPSPLRRVLGRMRESLAHRRA
ncbi:MULTISPECIES: hypothetical protein [Brachybacterium]|uniref:hypothetical protein n=1 Tax=Brachybacterium TaxID=43668 RepID=UPI000B03FB21|nr:MULTISPECIES: hypothetical protein [Brachybacterium]MCZ4325312.1 hypothetical protein [Brachybacterium paraconglomeratum]